MVEVGGGVQPGSGSDAMRDLKEIESSTSRSCLHNSREIPYSVAWQLWVTNAESRLATKFVHTGQRGDPNGLGDQLIK
eukprot:scaffold3234_cov56-Cylindrotheca_fusiformis.AAC.4